RSGGRGETSSFLLLAAPHPSAVTAGDVPHLHQLPLHLVHHQVRGLPAVSALQVIQHHRVRHLGGIERPLQPQLLRRQQLGLGVQLHDLLLQLRPPELDVLQALAQGVFGVLLGSPGAGGRSLGQVLGLGAAALRRLAHRRRLVEDARVAAVPLGQVVLGAGARPVAAGHIADIGGQRAGGKDRRLRLLGRRLLGLRHGGASAAPAPASSPHHSNRGGPAA
uniref:Uncharacterized protein n=1 Tax=Cyanoderma ruficeps TaxID=181631 RepID=A0A8C3R612_9PASS